MFLPNLVVLFLLLFGGSGDVWGLRILRPRQSWASPRLTHPSLLLGVPSPSLLTAH